jgi:hypothetical protein
MVITNELISPNYIDLCPMSKNDFISGAVLEFKVPGNFGYGYCKILDFRSIREFDGVLVKVFDHIVKEPIIDINILHDKNWLFGARRMPWLPGSRGKGAWKMKGVLIAENDNLIPDFKYCLGDSYLVEDPSKIGPWYAIRNINVSSREAYPYENIRHLEDTVVSTKGAIEKRTAMEFCRIHNIDINKFFDLEDVATRIAYRQMLNVPVYKTIPKEIREKVLEIH